MIGADEVVPLLLRSCPSFEPSWRSIEHDHVVDDGPRLHYLDAGAFARHLVRLQTEGRHDEVRASFAAIEILHQHGDPYVRELATIGYLEGVQFAASHTDTCVEEDFEQFLLPESMRWWRGLVSFWTGESPAVLPDDS